MKFIISVLLIFTFVATIYICVTRPTMHKSVLVYDSKYTINQEEIETVEEFDMPEMIQVQQPTQEKVTINQKIDNLIAREEAQTTYYTSSKQSPSTNVTTQTQTTSPKTSNQVHSSTTQPTQQTVQYPSTNVTQTTTQSQNTKTANTTTSQPTTSTVQTAPVGNTLTNTTIAKAPVGNTNVTTPNTTYIPQTTTQAPQPKVLTAQEEEIAWNKWRSNLQNNIMKDTRLPNIPLGTVFKFSFTVDKYGKVTNVKTWSTDARYTPYAIQYIAPVIRSYQGHSILNFPVGSNRVITDVTGSWRISSNASYSSPNDFNDIEKVTR